MKDTYLIKGLKKKRQESLEPLIDKYSNYVFTIVNNIARDYLSIEDIEETCGDVFLNLWKNVDIILDEEGVYWDDRGNITITDEKIKEDILEMI